MKAVTVWQPWASLIMAGVKPFEFRRWPAPESLVGQRIVIHAGARKARHDEVADLIVRLKYQQGSGTALKPEALPILEQLRREGCNTAMLAAGLGTVALGTPRRCTDLFRGQVADSDRIDEHMWAWPMLDVKPFDEPVPMRGAQGFWEWPVREAA